MVQQVICFVMVGLKGGRVAQLVEQCPFKKLLSYVPTADQSLTSGFHPNNWGKKLVFGSDCAWNCA
jgi:hypothetical protein